jgi:hypothetical protein
MRKVPWELALHAVAKIGRLSGERSGTLFAVEEASVGRQAPSYRYASFLSAIFTIVTLRASSSI